MKTVLKTRTSPGTSTSQGKRPVGDVRRTDPRIAWKGQKAKGPGARVIARKTY